MEDNVDYYRRRAAEEMAAAERAPDEVVANIHQSLAERYSALAGEPQPLAQQPPRATVGS